MRSHTREELEREMNAYKTPRNWCSWGAWSLTQVSRDLRSGGSPTECLRNALLTQWQMAADAYVLGWMSDRAMRRARLRFLRGAAEFYHHCDFPSGHEAARRKYPNDPIKAMHWEVWLRQEDAGRWWDELVERRRQRRLLRQGHRTLKDIRVLLRHGMHAPERSPADG